MAVVLTSLFGLILPLALLFEENVPVRMNEILQFLHADSYFLLKKKYIDIFRKGLWISILTFFVLEGCCHNLNFSLLNLCLKMLSSISDKFKFPFIFHGLFWWQAMLYTIYFRECRWILFWQILSDFTKICNDCNKRVQIRNMK